MNMAKWTQPNLTEHQRRKLANGVFSDRPDLQEFVAPDADKDCQARLPFGKYSGLTLGQILEQDPGYLHWMQENCDLHEGPFAAAFAAVSCRYQDRIEQASMQRNHRRF
jgi:hypothetical protein